MIGLDTNVLVQLLTGDDPGQREKAKEFIRRDCSADEPALINRVVLVETVWVLESVYRYSRKDIGAVVAGLLRMAHVVAEDADSVRSALTRYHAGADFSDALIARTNAQLGCTHTVTFDRRATRKSPDFIALRPCAIKSYRSQNGLR